MLSGWRSPSEHFAMTRRCSAVTADNIHRINRVSFLQRPAVYASITGTESENIGPVTGLPLSVSFTIWIMLDVQNQTCKKNIQRQSCYLTIDNVGSGLACPVSASPYFNALCEWVTARKCVPVNCFLWYAVSFIVKLPCC